MINKKINIVCIILMNILIMIGFVNAFSTSMSYSPGMPLNLYPGQSIDFSVVLQSSPTEGDLVIAPEISEGQEIVKITDSLKEYNVLANQPVGTEVHLKASIPDSAVIGETYPVKLSFRDITPKAGGGMIGLGITTNTAFNVVVVEKPPVTVVETPQAEGNLMTWVIGIIVVIVIIAIIWFIIKKKRE